MIGCVSNTIDVEHLAAACAAATGAHDPWTQNGALILHPSGETTAASNQIHHALLRDISGGEFHVITRRPVKGHYIEHAERAAIYAAAARGLRTQGATMYCPWFACADCARAIIASGITRVVGHTECRRATPDRWLKSIAIADTLFARSGVTTEHLESRLGVTIMFDGRQLKL